MGTRNRGQSVFQIVIVLALIAAIFLVGKERGILIVQDTKTAAELVDEVNMLKSNISVCENSYSKLKGFVGMPEDMVKRILSGEKSAASMRYLETVKVGSGMKGIVIKNDGEVPLSGFEFYVNEMKIAPVFTVDFIYPGHSAIIVLSEDDQREFEISAKPLRIKTAQGASLRIGAGEV